MKNIKEIGLDLIHLEDQILLVDNNKQRNINDFYLSRNAWGEGKHEINCWTEAKRAIISGKDSKAKSVIIASTKPLQGLPLLVIEDEVEKMAKEYTEKRNYLTEEEQGFVDGYNHAKSTYKFTEEDLMKCLKVVYDDWFEDKGHVERTEKEYFERIIQSVTKKELWMEVDYDHDDTVPYPKTKGTGYVLKITNGQIKAVWK